MAEQRSGTPRTIAICGHPVLRKKAAAVKRADRRLRQLLDDMVASMAQAPGLGLAAPQVGESVRAIIVAAEEDELQPYRVLNPHIVSRRGAEIGVEGCLSLPKLQGRVERAEAVTVKALDERRQPVTIEAEGLLARVFQHEIDHLDGVLFIDRAEEGTLAWNIPDEETEEGYRLAPTTAEGALQVFAAVLREGVDPLSVLLGQ